MILGVYGLHNSGKTQFLEKIIKELKKRDISAAAIKHLGGHYEPDTKTDTGRLAKAGFNPVIGAAPGELSMHMIGGDDLWTAIAYVHRLAAADVIFVEGFKNEPIEKIAVGKIKELPGTKFRGEQFDEILEYIERVVQEERAKLMEPSCCDDECRISGVKGSEKVKVKIIVNGKKVPANEFVQKMFVETISGMVRSLKGVGDDVESIEISVKKE